MKRINKILISLVILFTISCKWQKDPLDIDVSGIKVKEATIHRYDRDLFNIKVENLQQGLESIRSKYLFFLGTDLTDPRKLDEMSHYLRNPRNIEFHWACDVAFPNLDITEKDLTAGFRHFKYYFPGQVIPEVYSYISGGDYDVPVRLTDSVMIIALDCYLGDKFQPYISDGLPQYRIKRMTSDHIVPECMSVLVSRVCPSDQTAVRVIDLMIDTGKQHYLLDAMLPATPGHLKFDYTKEQYDWISKNEVHVWAAIIENKMLYSAEGKTVRLFFSDGPNTPEFGKESPPRIGEYIGFQIIKCYMNSHPDFTLQQLIDNTDYQSILTQSGYKPEK